jgi:glycosyltransferase involved in cell wall biosynthesis
VRRDEELYFAQVLRVYRGQLAEALFEASRSNKRLTRVEARLLINLAESSLGPLEEALRRSASTRGALSQARAVARLKRITTRVRSWTKPRIGRLRHYPAKPLRVPRSYLSARPPANVPTISLVTPSYGQGQFIERTLNSVISQNYPALDYVVQDGGSEDQTVEILSRYEDALSAWASEKDGGQAEAINRGFARTNGEIMGWLNSDDLLLPGSLAYVARCFAAHPDVDVVYGHRIMIDENDGQIGAWVLPAHDDRALTLADYVPQETLFWRRPIWEAAGGYVDQDFAYAIDWELLLRFREVGAKMTRLPRFLGAFRVHDAQKTSAEEDLGSTECARLRRRVHGRDLTIEQVLRELRPYFLRHVLVHTRVRAADRLHLRRIVDVRPFPTRGGGAHVGGHRAGRVAPPDANYRDSAVAEGGWQHGESPVSASGPASTEGKPH